MARILGIDPGTANTGLVVLEDGKFTVAHTITTKPSKERKTRYVGHDTAFENCLDRSDYVSKAVASFIAAYGPFDVIAAEGYKDYGGKHLRDAKNRWMTTVTCAFIDQAMSWAKADTTELIWQDPQVVMTAYRGYKNAWANKSFGVCPGDELLTNDHLRSAAAHALFANQQLKLRRK